MNAPAAIRVLIVDDHAVVRGGLKFFMATTPDIEVVGEADNGVRALHMCTQLQPDVVLMDLVMPEMDGITATKAIRDQFPHIQVIALTSFQEEDLVQRALRAGAISYLLKDVATSELFAAIHAAHAGRSVLAPDVTRMLVRAVAQPHRLGHDLTEREQEVLRLLVVGLSNGQIADQLVISRNTVRHHVRNILAKLDASNRTEAVGLALKHNIVVPPSPVSNS